MTAFELIQVKSPSRRIGIGEVNPIYNNHGYVFDVTEGLGYDVFVERAQPDFYNSGYWPMFSARHSKRGNVLCLDCHVNSLTTKDLWPSLNASGLSNPDGYFNFN